MEIRTTPFDRTATPLAWIQHHALILPTPNVLEGLVKVLPAAFDGCGFLLVAIQVGVNEFDEAIEVLCSNLKR